MGDRKGGRTDRQGGKDHDRFRGTIRQLDGDRITFPDAATSRGRKHLEMLRHCVELGHRAVILFAVNRPEGQIFSVARDIDPEYQEILVAVLAAGVQAIAFRIVHTDTGVEAGGLVPIDLDGN